MDQTMNPKLKNINVFSSPQCFLASFSSFFLFVIIIVAKIMGPPPVAVPQTSVFYANDDTVMGQSNEMQNVTMYLLMKFHLM